jgi:hypothetical protein
MERTRVLKPEDLIFPGLDKQGRPKIGERFSATRIQNILVKFTEATGHLEGRNGRFTTHCFRRGGAQHRFMFADEKWSLKAVKWWGGWSEGEGTGTIVRYLLDEYIQYESGFGDMLSPDRSDHRHHVFMGSSGDLPVTQRTIEDLRCSIQNEVRKEIQSTVASVTMSLSQIQSAIVRLEHKVGNLPLQQVPQQQLIQPSISWQAQPETAPQVETATMDQPPAAPRIPTITSWKDAIRQWYHGDVQKGLNMPLNQWTKGMKTTDPSRFSQRKLIADEYEYWGKNEKNMLDCHGNALDKVGDLIASIRFKKTGRKELYQGIKRPRRNSGGGSSKRRKGAASTAREESEDEENEVEVAEKDEDDEDTSEDEKDE